ncbi:PTS system ascorbate-specific IIA component [Variovorax paradoxus]|jgi:PTS system mannose-specific IIA component|uniref:PTS fructose transporter subunit IIA n=1 Tax=Variovorax paradoxus TaxID=34073 RepID=A0A6I6HN94_VARPD|nr:MULTISPECIES: PTS fructose transporter subunit IIA [Variovorax]KQU82277.1 PTS fructose transporter subunit IIA [Variovorax sp. Root318D1]MDP9931639.1 PTS system ascorbate-specific IIA component [Variovorax paradoxus]MDQ0025241.1 PTS system ascorbate-specific IIA component [Variovorax paradoxus]QGW84451.1 PTS fructose transporter subunit IIA [Variovorax paradoxus]SDI33266.1 PTS system, ascorbate-specific IIA component [Variovorax sp. OV700]
MNSILIIAHSPFAQALRRCALHVFPDCEQAVVALDVLPNVSPEETLAAARITLEQQLNAPRSQVLVLADVFGATPCNVAQKLVDGVRSRLVAGVNLPMLLRAVTYRHEPLETLVQRAIAGGTAGVMQVAVAAPQNQAKRKHSDQEIRDHQQ